jgi:hypothetical protein
VSIFYWIYLLNNYPFSPSYQKEPHSSLLFISVQLFIHKSRSAGQGREVVEKKLELPDLSIRILLVLGPS